MVEDSYSLDPPSLDAGADAYDGAINASTQVGTTPSRPRKFGRTLKDIGDKLHPALDAARNRILEVEATPEMRVCADRSVGTTTQKGIEDEFDVLSVRGGNELKSVSPLDMRLNFEAFHERRFDALLIRNAVTIPDDLEPSPRHGDPSIEARRFGMACAYYLCAASAVAIAYANENDGDPIRDIVTKEGRENEASSHGRARHWHVEHSQRRDDGRDGQSAPCDYFAFVCLRNELGIGTDIAFLEPLLTMPPAVVEQLKQENYDFDASISTGDDAPTLGLPILTESIAGPKFRYNEARLRMPEDPDQREAIKIVESYLNMEAARTSIVLRPGDVLLIAQRRLVHRHGGGGLFDPDRWLIRMYGMAADSITLPVKGAGKSWVLD